MKTFESFLNNTYAYICDKKACDGSCPNETPCTHTLDPAHSITLQNGKNPVFVKLMSHKFYEAEDLSELTNLFY